MPQCLLSMFVYGCKLKIVLAGVSKDAGQAGQVTLSSMLQVPLGAVCILALPGLVQSRCRCNGHFASAVNI